MRRATRGRPAIFPVPLLALLALAAASGAAEDRVTVRTDSGAGTAVLTGRVVDWTGGLLKVRSGEEVREVETDRVVSVDSPKSQKHADGLKSFEAGKPAEANRLLSEALGEEPREWMRREILAALTRVDLARGDRAAALTDFVALVESDPTTRRFAVIPLDWGTSPPDPAAAAVARPWLRSGGSEVERLLGASVLLFDPAEGENAYMALNRLGTASDRRIFMLARAQMWRRTLSRGDVPEGEIERWEDRIGEIPEPLRGGPFSLVGRAWAEAGSPERASAALLWLPLVYDSDAILSADSELAAADALERIGRTADAVVLYREVAARFAYTPSAAVAKAALERMSGAKTPGASAPPPSTMQ